ncbi:glycosyltransferase [Actinidia rufa]|uniref:Glycosyltransferase n=1 Tax=Actinidia rufa TaxID=165716 RepID=A0A7J0DCB1_9ERIC|nr:glycosyltransferase [Actinidia rufa]
MENQQTESIPLDEQVGLINEEAGVETLEQIMQYLLEPDSSMVDADVENVERIMQYLLEADSPLDSMPPLMEAKPAPTVDEDSGHPSGENEARILPSSNCEYAVLDYINSLASAPEVTTIENDVGILEQPSINKKRRLLLVASIHREAVESMVNENVAVASSNPEYEVLDYIHSLASAPEVTAIENDVGILEQPSIPPPESLPADSHGHAVLNFVIPSATPAPTVEPSWVESFSEDLLSGKHNLPWEEREEESELLFFPNPTYMIGGLKFRCCGPNLSLHDRAQALEHLFKAVNIEPGRVLQQTLL